MPSRRIQALLKTKLARAEKLQALLNSKLAEAALANVASNVQALLLRGADPRFNACNALSLAADRGHLDCVLILSPLADESGATSAFGMAVRAGHAECVRALAPFSRPLDTHPTPIFLAVAHNHPACVRILMEGARALPELGLMRNLIEDASKKGPNTAVGALRSFLEARELSASFPDVAPTRGPVRHSL